MKKLYLMRHGETYFNRIQKTQGWCDSPLTERGIEQAQQARDYFISQGISFDYALSSSLSRSVDTLDIIAQDYILQTEISKDLRELSFGRFEGESTAILPPLPFQDYFLAYGGESEEQALARFSNKIVECIEEEAVTHLLVVSHGTIIRNFCLHWQPYSQVAFDTVNKNGSILIFNYEDQVFRLENYVSFDQ